MYEDHEFDPISPEEQARREADAELSRRIRREVRRMERGEADEDLAADEAQEQAEREAQEALRRKAERRGRNPLWQLVSGTILVRESISRSYSYLVLIAVGFFVSIVVLFWSLHLDRRYIRLEREVQGLRERSIRFEEQRFRRTTHSAIVREIEERGLPLKDPQKPRAVIED